MKKAMTLQLVHLDTTPHPSNPRFKGQQSEPQRRLFLEVAILPDSRPKEIEEFIQLWQMFEEQEVSREFSPSIRNKMAKHTVYIDFGSIYDECHDYKVAQEATEKAGEASDTPAPLPVPSSDPKALDNAGSEPSFHMIPGSEELHQLLNEACRLGAGGGGSAEIVGKFIQLYLELQHDKARKDLSGARRERIKAAVSTLNELL